MIKHVTMQTGLRERSVDLFSTTLIEKRLKKRTLYHRIDFIVTIVYGN